MVFYSCLQSDYTKMHFKIILQIYHSSVIIYITCGCVLLLKIEPSLRTGHYEKTPCCLGHWSNKQICVAWPRHPCGALLMSAGPHIRTRVCPAGFTFRIKAQGPDLKPFEVNVKKQIAFNGLWVKNDMIQTDMVLNIQMRWLKGARGLLQCGFWQLVNSGMQFVQQVLLQLSHAGTFSPCRLHAVLKIWAAADCLILLFLGAACGTAVRCWCSPERGNLGFKTSHGTSMFFK